jgi:uncharacterized protein (TIGR02444 family)
MTKDRAARPRGEAAEPDFWAWSLARYQRDGVAALCLRLQDECAFNVNILLWACWCAEWFEAPSARLLRKAYKSAEQWNRNVAAPLRKTRRFVKAWSHGAEAESLRVHIKTAELASEKMEQALLAAEARSAFARTPVFDMEEIRQRARKNLTHYAANIGAARCNGFDASWLQLLVDRIFEDAPETCPKEGSPS